jgi:hypothetical protein
VGRQRFSVSPTQKKIVLFCCIGFHNTSFLQDLVIASLKSANINVSTQESDLVFCESLCDFLKQRKSIAVCLKDNTISCQSEGTYFQICELEHLDLPAQEFFVRSLCLLLAVCGKNVSNTIDNFELNEYGITSTIDQPEGKDEDLYDDAMF